MPAFAVSRGPSIRTGDAIMACGFAVGNFAFLLATAAHFVVDLGANAAAGPAISIEATLTVGIAVGFAPAAILTASFNLGLCFALGLCTGVRECVLCSLGRGVEHPAIPLNCRPLLPLSWSSHPRRMDPSRPASLPSLISKPKPPIPAGPRLA